MRYPLSLLLLALLCIFSCSDDDSIDMDSDAMDEEMVDELILDDFIWERLTDTTSTIASRESYFVQHPIFFDDLVIYHNPKLNGFIALDAASGAEVWNNYGLVETGFLFTEPKIHNGLLYFIDNSRQKLIIINAIDGEGILEYESFFGTKVNELSIFEDQLYIATQYDDEENYTEFTTVPVKDINTLVNDDWPIILEDDSNLTDGTKLLFHKNNQGETLIIFSTSNSDKHVNAYNIDQETFEWRFSSEPISGEVSMINDDMHIYFAKGFDLFCLDINTGNIIWKNESTFFNDLSSGLYLKDNTLIALGTEAYSFNTTNGNQNWRKDNFATEDFGSILIRSKESNAAIYQDHIYFYKRREQSYLLKMDIFTGDIDHFYLADSREVDGLDTPLQTLDFDSSDFKMSDDGVIYSHDQYRLFAFKAP